MATRTTKQPATTDAEIDALVAAQAAEPTPDADVSTLTGPLYVERICSAGDVGRLTEIAQAALVLVTLGVPVTSEAQGQAATALQRAVLNLPR